MYHFKQKDSLCVTVTRSLSTVVRLVNWPQLGILESVTLTRLIFMWPSWCDCRVYVLRFQESKPYRMKIKPTHNIIHLSPSNVTVSDVTVSETHECHDITEYRPCPSGNSPIPEMPAAEVKRRALGGEGMQAVRLNSTKPTAQAHVLSVSLLQGRNSMEKLKLNSISN